MEFQVPLGNPGDDGGGDGGSSLAALILEVTDTIGSDNRLLEIPITDALNPEYDRRFEFSLDSPLSIPGSYTVRLAIRDPLGNLSDWSDSLPVVDFNTIPSGMIEDWISQYDITNSITISFDTTYSSTYSGSDTKVYKLIVSPGGGFGAQGSAVGSSSYVGVSIFDSTGYIIGRNWDYETVFISISLTPGTYYIKVGFDSGYDVVNQNIDFITYLVD